MGTLDYPIELCYERGMNCTSTCCKQTYCAPTMGDCIHYVRKDYMELYTCVIVVLMIVLGIPTCIRTMEFLLMYKFCRKFDADENCFVGGTTMLECFTNCCKKKDKEDKPEMEMEEHHDEDYGESMKVDKNASVFKPNQDDGE